MDYTADAVLRLRRSLAEEEARRLIESIMRSIAIRKFWCAPATPLTLEIVGAALADGFHHADAIMVHADESRDSYRVIVLECEMKAGLQAAAMHMQANGTRMQLVCTVNAA